MPPAKFEPTIPASERPQTHALDRAATGTCPLNLGHIIVIATRESSVPNSWERLAEQTSYALGVADVHRLTWELYGYTVHIQRDVQCAG
jgi:hypothetical protein